MSRWFFTLATCLCFALTGETLAAEHRIPPPRPQAHVEEILAQADKFSTDRKLNVVLLAGPKDHGPFEHDYPLWHKRWKVLVGGLEQGDERVLNIFGAPLTVTDEEVAGAENVELSTAWVWPSDEQWQQADLVVMYSAPPPWTPERLAQLEAFLARGGGFVSIHMSMWQDSKELADLIGIGKHAATWFRHGPVRLELADHDITRGLPETVDLVDESYFNFQGDPNRVNILATGKETRPGETQVRDEPLYWTFEHGKGRVFVCIPGHYMWSFDDPYFRIILLRGMAWAAGESPFRFDPLVLRGARVYRPSESEAPKATDQNLVLWLDATQRDSLTVETGQVSAWKNKAAGRQDAVTSEGSARPRYVAEGIGGQASLRFDGKDDVLRNPEFGESATKWTLLLVVAPKSNQGDGVPNGFHGFFSANAPGGLDWFTGLTIDMGGYATNRFNALNVESNKGTGAGNLLYSGSDFGQPRVLAAVSDGLETTLYAEGEPQLSRKANDSPTSFAQIRVGARYYHQERETGFLDGDIAEVLLYNTALPDERIRSLSHHLQSKYGVAAVVEGEVSGSLDDAIAALPQLDWTLARAPLAPIDRALRSSDPSERADLEQRLVKVLEQGANPAATDYIARRLAMIGTARSVPALARLLTDRERAPSACQALTEIEAKEAGDALVAALSQAEGAIPLQIIEGLALRRESQGVQPLLALLDEAGETDLQGAIATALGEIGDARAIEPLISRHGVPASALLTLASRLAEQKNLDGAERVYRHLEQEAPAHLKAAILAGRVASDVATATERIQQALMSDDPVLFGQGAAILAHQAPESVVAEVLAEFANWRPPVQRAVLGQRWNRLPEQGRKLALAALESDESEVRADGLILLSQVGKAEDVGTLAELATQAGATALAARHSLRHLNAEGVDQAMLEGIAEALGVAQVELIRAASDRRIKRASDTLLAYVSASDESVRLAAIEALQVVGEPSAVDTLLPELLASEIPAHQAALERAVWLCAGRAASDEARIAPLLAAYETATPVDKAKLLPVMGRLGGERALDVIESAQSDGTLRSAAVRGLANWPDATVADRLLLAAREEASDSDRTAALRAYIRVVTLSGVRKDDETLAMLKEALPLVKRPEEVRLVISRLPAIRTTGSLDLASSYLDDPAMGDAEVAAVTRLAEALIADAPDQAREVMKRLLPKTTDAALRARLERAIARP